MGREGIRGAVGVGGCGGRRRMMRGEARAEAGGGRGGCGDIEGVLGGGGEVGRCQVVGTEEEEAKVSRWGWSGGRVKCGLWFGGGCVLDEGEVDGCNNTRATGNLSIYPRCNVARKGVQSLLFS